MTLDKMIEAAHDYAKSVLIGHGGAELPPTFVIGFKNAPPTILVAPWSNEKEKAAFLAAVSSAMKLCRADIVGYSVVSEAWVATQNHMPRADERPPSERDDRREVVFACASDGEAKRFRAWEIERGPDAVVTALVQSAEMTGFDGLGGRMSNLLEARA